MNHNYDNSRRLFINFVVSHCLALLENDSRNCGFTSKIKFTS